MAKNAEETVETEAPAKKVKAKVACLCGQVEAIYKSASVPARTAKNGWALEVGRGGIVKATTGCEDETSSRFAPGHDSRLVGLLQDAIRADDAAQVSVNGDKMDLVEWIEGVSEHLAEKVKAPAPVKKAKAKVETDEDDDADAEPEPEVTPIKSRRRRTV